MSKEKKGKGLPKMTNGKVIFTPLEENKTKKLQGKIYTEQDVIKLLKKQIVECAKKIDADNLSQYTARKKIYETELVKID